MHWGQGKLFCFDATLKWMAVEENTLCIHNSFFTWHKPLSNFQWEISCVDLVGHESWLAWAAARLTLSCSLWLDDSGGIGDPALQKRIWVKQYLNYSSCSANCSLGQHWLVLNWPKVKCFCLVQQSKVFWLDLPNIFCKKNPTKQKTIFNRITSFWIIWTVKVLAHIFCKTENLQRLLLWSRHVGGAQGNLTMFREESLLKCTI